MHWILARFSEGSTWAAIAASGVLGLLHIDPNGGLWPLIAQFGVAAAALAAFILKDAGANK